MPWTAERFPKSMQNLPAWVREKAIDIANALLAEGMDEGKAIRIAIAKAKEWARRDLPSPDAALVPRARRIGRERWPLLAFSESLARYQLHQRLQFLGKNLEQIVHGDDTGKRAVLIDDRNPAYAFAPHQLERVEHVFGFRDRDQFRTLDVARRKPLGRNVGSEHFDHDVAIRDQSDGETPAVAYLHDNQRADVIFPHQPRYLLYFRRRCAEHDIPCTNFTDTHENPPLTRRPHARGLVGR